MANVVMMLVDPDSFQRLLSMKPLDLFIGMEKQELRHHRPDPIRSLHRPFSVDVEGDLLDAWDASTGKAVQSIMEIKPLEAKSLTIHALCKWASTAEWNSWDARAYLYLEPYVTTSIDLDNLLRPGLWKDFASSLSSFSRGEYVDSVTRDWIARRDELGASTESGQDPYLLSTMSAHRSNSSDLYDISKSIREDKPKIMLGIEQTPACDWTLDGTLVSDIRGMV